MRELRRSIRLLAELIGRRRRWRWWLLVAFALVSSWIEAVGASLVYLLIGNVFASSSTLALPFVGEVSDLWPSASAEMIRIALALGLVVFFLLRSGFILLRAYVQARLTNNAAVGIANDLLRGYLAMPYLLHTQRSSAELIRNTYSATERVTGQVLNPLIVLVSEIIVGLGLLLILAITAPLATVLAVVVFLPALWLLQSRIQPKLSQLGRQVQTSNTGSIAAVQQSLGAIRDIKLLERGPEFASAHIDHRVNLARSQYLAQVLKETPRVLIENALIITIVVVFIVSVATGSAVEEIAATLGLFAYTGLRLQPSLHQTVRSLNEIRFGAPVLEDLITDRREMSTWLEQEASARRALHSHGTRPVFVRSVDLSEVSFAYTPDGPRVLDGIDLTVRAGEFVGICGPTGGGKSTLIDLLVGLLEPTFGTVRVDGRDLGPRPGWWWSQLGVVSQQVFLLDDTLTANIAFGQPTTEVDAQRLEASVRAAQLDEVVDGLPEGLDTVVGERGIRLSGGQRQRVAIARALYRDPPVLVLDEGTSALDGATEAALVAAIDQRGEGRTLITIAHRLTTLRAADRILVVDGGRIVDEGRYSELLERSETFRLLAG